MRWTPLSVLSSVLMLCAAAPSEAQQREPTIASAFRARGAKELAQTGIISGVVTEASSGRPVAGAQVGIARTQLGAATNADGRFTIANV